MPEAGGIFQIFIIFKLISSGSSGVLGRIVVCRVGMAPRNDREGVKYPNMVGKNVLKMTTRLIMTIEKLRNVLSRNAQVCRRIFSLA